MFRLAFISILFVVLTSCSLTKPSEFFKSTDLVGTWELKFDGVYPYWFSQIGFTEDGRKCVLSYEFDTSGRVSMDYYLSKYKVEDGYLYSEIAFSSTPYVRTGEVIKDRIDILVKDYFEVFMVGPLSGSTAERHQRLSDVSPEELCKIVENFRITSNAKAASAVRAF